MKNHVRAVISLLLIMPCCIGIVLAGCAVSAPAQDGSTTSTPMNPLHSFPTNHAEPNGTEPAPHEHVYESLVTEPTCTKTGQTTYRCSCGSSYQDNVTEPTGHVWSEWKITLAPTDETNGEAVRTCRTCLEEEKKILPVETPSHSHSFVVTDARPSSCTNNGYTSYICNCGATYTETLPHSGHKWGDWITSVLPTETANGEALRICTSCSQKETNVLPAGHKHDYIYQKYSTYVTYTCDCGQCHTAPLGHSHSFAKKVTIPASCTEGGYVIYECTTCGKEMYTDYGLPKGHTYGEWSITKPATETETGMQEKYCIYCHALVWQVLPVSGEVRESYIDPRLEVSIVGRQCYLSYTYVDGSLGVTNKASWDNSLSIRINENNGLDIVYYQQDGTRVEYTLVPPEEGFFIRLTIREDGTFTTAMNGSIAGNQ